MEKLKPLLLLHGALGCKDQLEALAGLCESEGREVYAMNFSGHGGAPYSKNGFGIEVFADDVISFLDEHKLSQVDVLGYSMGGYVALWCCTLYPERFGEIVTLGTKFDWSPASAEKEIKKMNPAKIQEKFPAFARLLERRHAPNNWQDLMAKTAAMMESLGRSPLLNREVLQNILQPVSVLLGDGDDMADRAFSEEVTRWLPNARFELLTDTPHPIEKVNLVYLMEKARSNR